MGFSYVHSTQVSLVLNLNTLSISPQYHVIFDDIFTSVTSGTDKTPIIPRNLIPSPNNILQVNLDKEDKTYFNNECSTKGEAEHRENQRNLEAMIRGRNSKELILDTILTKVTCQTPVSESPNQEGILSNIEEAAASSQLDHYEVKF